MVLEVQNIQIRLDEPALSLYEFERIRPDSRGFNRYQYIRVIRNDRVAVYEADMGPREQFNHGPLYIAGGFITFGKRYFNKKTRVWWLPGETTFLPSDIPYSHIRKIESVHAVGQLLNVAEVLREDGPNVLYEPEPRDFAREYVDQMEDIYKWRTGHCTFGPGGSLVRDL